jgi:glucosamine-6-phosphate deaminase
VELAPETTRAAARYFGPVPAPTWGVTIGLGPLRASRTIWLLATGPSKADVVRDVLLEPMSVDRPASLLRAHPHCLFILDRAAAARLPRHLLGRPASPGRSG